MGQQCRLLCCNNENIGMLRILGRYLGSKGCEKE